MTDTGTVRPPLNLALRALLRADATVLLRSKISATLSILLPVVILVATTFGKSQHRLGGTTLTIGLALVIGLPTSSMLGFTLAIAGDRDTGVLQRLHAAPVPTWAIMGSRMGVQVAANLVGSIIVVVVGVILHGLALDAGQVLLVLGAALLGGVTFLSIGQAVVGLVKSSAAVLAVSRVIFIVLILLGLVGGTGLLGDTLKSIAEWTPVGALMTLFADILNRAGWSAQDGWALLACVAWTVVCAGIGIRWFRWESR
ncbi:ABC transporter permease [Arthrobacter sp. STN4]|uniref:ABC transporter permease n=1 Tax=Arthrobacter sp. STN4 TaxID=2923276 RepID=UPI002119D509|nr:ABC transporter permease [Arthrobacter sp. STN4]MCQ9163465.1 ABC transporter permease [Arthrobacter sp. STN4]